MLGRPAAAVAPKPIAPRPVHNERGSVFVMARGMLAEMDRSRETVTLPTPTLELILTTLCDVMQGDNATAQQTQHAMDGAMAETQRAAGGPNLRLWRPMTASTPDEDDE